MDLAPPPPPPPPPPPWLPPSPPKTKRPWYLKTWVLITAGVIVLLVVVSVLTAKPTPTAKATATTTATPKATATATATPKATATSGAIYSTTEANSILATAWSETYGPAATTQGSALSDVTADCKVDTILTGNFACVVHFTLTTDGIPSTFAENGLLNATTDAWDPGPDGAVCVTNCT